MNYYAEGDCGRFWEQTVAADAVMDTQELPHSDFSRYDYADSYLAIAMAALSCLDNIQGGSEAYAFARSNLTVSNLANNPTWAMSMQQVEKAAKISTGNSRLSEGSARIQ